MTPRRIASLALLVALAAACGGSDDSPPPTSNQTPQKSTPSTTTYDGFSQLYATAYCAAASSCCEEKGENSDTAVCEKNAYQQLSLIAESVTYDKDKGKTCITKLKALAGKSTACDTLDKGVTECSDALALSSETPGGSKKPGDGCAETSECAAPEAGEARCQEVGVEAKKICQHVLEGASAATPCVGDTRQTLAVNDDPKVAVGVVYRCAETLRCDPSTRACVASLPVGGSCIASFDCTKNTFCSQGKCVAAAADGAACADDDGCLSTSYCNAQKKCAAQLAAGAACEGADRCSTGACVNGKCPAAESDSKLTCF